MAAKILDGKSIAEQIHRETASRVENLRTKGVVPVLRFVRVGEDPASRAYVGMKEKKAAELGIDSRTIVLPEATTEDELLTHIKKLNDDKAVHAILVQAPLPGQICEQRVFSTVSPMKDVDGFHPLNMGRLLLGDTQGFRPCTPAGIVELLRRYGVKTQGAEVVVLGRGNIVGKPLAAMLCQKAEGADATVTLVHSRTRNIKEHCRRADILVAAMGHAEFVRGEMVKPGAVVIDVGVNRVADPRSQRGFQLVGDVCHGEVVQVAAALTPNPGGVGPMTIAMLMANTVRAAELACEGLA